MSALAQVILELCLALLVPDCLVSVVGAGTGSEGRRNSLRWRCEPTARFECWRAMLIDARLAGGAVAPNALGQAVVVGAADKVAKAG